MTPPCPAPEEVSRQLSLGEQGPLAEHLAICPTCTLEWEGLRTVRSLASELPGEVPEPRAAHAMRDRVVALAQAEQRRARTRSAGGWALLAVAAAVVLAIGLRSRRAAEPVEVYRATLTPSPSARFVRESAEPTEIVRLVSGMLHVSVEKLHAGERFFVRAGDGEVEVRGTAFDVAVLDGHLSAVHVDHGRVEVRSPEGGARILGAGDDWQRPADHVDAPPAEPATNPASNPAPSPPLASAERAVELGPRARAPAPVSAPPLVRSARVVLPPGSAEVDTPPVPVTSSAAPASATATRPRALVAPASSAPSAIAPAAPASDDAREVERRERQDERRERGDQRRLR